MISIILEQCFCVLDEKLQNSEYKKLNITLAESHFDFEPDEEKIQPIGQPGHHPRIRCKYCSQKGGLLYFILFW